MHYYICPYCPQNGQAILFPHKELGIVCDCKKSFFDKNKECKLIEYKCKEVLKCIKCEESFSATKEFLREQKRKIKDG